MFSSEDEEILPFPWQLLHDFVLELNYALGGTKGKWSRLYWSTGEYGATEGLWEKPNPSLLAERAAGGLKPSVSDAPSSGQHPAAIVTASVSPGSAGQAPPA